MLPTLKNFSQYQNFITGKKCRGARQSDHGIQSDGAWNIAEKPSGNAWHRYRAPSACHWLDRPPAFGFGFAVTRFGSVFAAGFGASALRALPHGSTGALSGTLPSERL